jgi:DNA-binding NtrC family response regulator
MHAEGVCSYASLMGPFPETVRADDMQARVVFLDDNEDLRELLPIVLESELGVECLCFGTVMEFQKHSKDVLLAKVAILDINLGPCVPDGIDAFNWLMDQGFRGKILFLTGHARTNPQVALAERKGAEVLEKPLQPHQLISIVRRALNRAA